MKYGVGGTGGILGLLGTGDQPDAALESIVYSASTRLKTSWDGTGSHVAMEQAVTWPTSAAAAWGATAAC